VNGEPRPKPDRHSLRFVPDDWLAGKGRVEKQQRPAGCRRAVPIQFNTPYGLPDGPPPNRSPITRRRICPVVIPRARAASSRATACHRGNRSCNSTTSCAGWDRSVGTNEVGASWQSTNEGMMPSSRRSGDPGLRQSTVWRSRRVTHLGASKRSAERQDSMRFRSPTP
jgi:hypothetical protein